MKTLALSIVLAIGLIGCKKSEPQSEAAGEEFKFETLTWNSSVTVITDLNTGQRWLAVDRCGIVELTPRK